MFQLRVQKPKGRIKQSLPGEKDTGRGSVAASGQAGAQGQAAQPSRAGPGRRRPAPGPSPAPRPAAAARPSGARCRKVNSSTRPSWASRPDPLPRRPPRRPLCNRGQARAGPARRGGRGAREGHGGTSDPCEESPHTSSNRPPPPQPPPSGRWPGRWATRSRPRRTRLHEARSPARRPAARSHTGEPRPPPALPRGWSRPGRAPS